MRHHLLAAWLLLLAACAHGPRPDAVAGPPGALPPGPAPESGADRAFDALARDFLERYLGLFPVDATGLGDHRFDDRWPRLGAEGEAEERAFLAWAREALSRVPAAGLSAERRVDARILAHRLEAWRFDLDELRSWRRDPLLWVRLVGDGLDPLLTRDFAPLQQRMASAARRLAGVPAVLAAARARLERPPRIFTETAILQARGLVGLVEEELPAAAAGAPGVAPEVARQGRVAGAALRDFVAWLERELLPRSDGAVRLGRARWERKLQLELDTPLSADEVSRRARALLAETQEAMFSTALELWPALFPGEGRPAGGTPAARLAAVRRALDAVAQDRPADASVVEEARAVADSATAFARTRGLVTLPEVPLRVIEVPAWRRGVTVAYCDSAGALERNPVTFVAISPTPEDWPAARRESFYREYNRAMLADLMVHEAMPGHFLQIALGNRGATPVRAVFQSGTFVEGWAVYAEGLMARHGFGGARTRLQREKMLLRVAANALLDQGLHAGDLDEAGAMRLLREEALQEEGEAVGKWRRAQLTSAQLSTYAVGYLEVSALRERAERQPGFTERVFHDRLLAHGSPAPRDLATLLFGEP